MHSTYNLGICCDNCDESGHYGNKCPKPKRRNAESDGPSATISDNGIAMLLFIKEQEDIEDEIETMFTQLMMTSVPKNWVLLDSQSTVCVFRSSKYLTNICEGTKRLRLITNGG